MNVIIDTNLWISFILCKKLDVLQKILMNPAIDVYVCDELVNEFVRVLSKPKILKRSVYENARGVHELLRSHCRHVQILKQAVSPIRDPNDLYLLSLAETVSADFVITGDKDLLALQRHAGTRIVTCAEFNDITN